MARVIESRRRNTRTKAGAVLSADVIVDAALALVGEHGAAGLSVRRLGGAIGCDPTAIYRYFASVDALFLAMGDRLIARTLDGYRPGEDWKDNLRTLARRTYAEYVAHPRVAIAVASRVTGGAHERRIIDLVLGELRRAGFAGERAVRLYRSFGDFILAFSAVDADFLARPGEVRAADLQRWQDAYGDVDAEQFPNLAAEAPIVVAHATVNTFELCLELLLDQIEALALIR
ncbi:TetR/AcrR family transcriptional regulator [Actinospica sp.]|uniref:TetR/AcrR family transcriptional regulator n=1 Tax=Actinospica sp. TaxID=1872142 RepID=UPI002BDACED2|nr:TetR/AcrR family transcriptional regulator [Actinospica sp.]HWG27657.1 TetR/AcrR family transcriptional regulator [Actinospica sp.]